MSNIFEIRLKNNGRLFSRHYEAKTAEQAVKRVNGRGKILSVRKVHSSDIIGTIDSMNLRDIIGLNVRGGQDVILSGATLDSILFPKGRGRKRNKEKKDRRFNDEVE